MTAHKNISGTYHLSVADILQVTQVCFSPSVEINQDGVAALITTLDRRIVMYWMRLSIFVSFSRARVALAARTSLTAKSRFQKHS